MNRTFGLFIFLKFVLKLLIKGSAIGEETVVVLKAIEAEDPFTVEGEGGNSILNNFFGIWQNFSNSEPNRLKCISLRLIKFL